MKAKQIKKQIKEVKKDAEKEFKKLQGMAKTKIKSFSTSAGKEVAKVKDEFEELETKVKKYIHNNPEKLFIAAAGIGAFVGAVTATLLKRKSKKKK